MKWFNNLNIAKRLIMGFLIIAVIAAFVGIIGIVNINKIDKEDTALYELNTLGLQYSGEASTNYQRIRYNALKILSEQDNTTTDNETMSKINDLISETDEQLKNYEMTISNDEDRALVNELQTNWEQYKVYIQQFIQAVNANNYEKGLNIILKDAGDTGDALMDEFEEIMKNNATEAMEKSVSNESMAQKSIIIMIIIIVAGVLISIALGLVISNGISKPIGKIVTAANKLAVGDLNIVATIDTTDEVGVLAKSFMKLVESTKEQAQAIQKVADADLDVEVTARSENDLMGKKLSILVDELNQIMANIASAAEQVAAGSRQISDSSMALSQGATEQASSIEELTASIEEIASQTKMNSQNANQANELAENAKLNAIQGNGQMKEMLKAMEEINESSSNISKIIKVIDDIAFQTNILALNAAVEAARAGQHGKGFAVVAEEVRNLAARSANAAKETTEMIEGSIKKAEGGTRIAKETAEALNKIVNGIEKVAELVNGISVASNEQDAGISQINQGIMQVSQVVQTNSATSEESAAASEELSSQAELLKNTVNKFKLKKNTKAIGKLEELSPDVLKMLESMSQKEKFNPNKREGFDSDKEEVSNKTKIALSDKEFGKY